MRVLSCANGPHSNIEITGHCAYVQTKCVFVSTQLASISVLRRSEPLTTMEPFTGPSVFYQYAHTSEMSRGRVVHSCVCVCARVCPGVFEFKVLCMVRKFHEDWRNSTSCRLWLLSLADFSLSFFFFFAPLTCVSPVAIRAFGT